MGSLLADGYPRGFWPKSQALQTARRSEPGGAGRQAGHRPRAYQFHGRARQNVTIHTLWHLSLVLDVEPALLLEYRDPAEP
jgi:hypothetical protein